MTMNINWTSQPATDAGMDNEYNGSYNSSSNDQYNPLEISIIDGFILVICSMGFGGNGTVIWLLGFCMRRKPFTTYILNLAVADFAFLLSLQLHNFIYHIDYIHHTIAVCLLAFTYTTGQLLLTAISIDRCLSVLFPLWHRCHRPTQLSTTVCALIWVLSFLLSIILYILLLIRIFKVYFQYLFTGLFSLPLMTISTVILFIKVCFKSNQRKRGRLLMVILLTLLFFLILAYPLNALFLSQMLYFRIPYLLYYTFLCASLNSSVNPLIYFLVGRRNGGQTRENLTVILQRALNEEENERRDIDPPCSNPLMKLS